MVSCVFHLVIAIVWIFGPMFWSKPNLNLDAINVELVGSLPGPINLDEPEPNPTNTIPTPQVTEPEATQPEETVVQTPTEQAPTPSPPDPEPTEDTAMFEEKKLKRLDPIEESKGTSRPQEIFDAAAAERERQPQVSGGGGGSGAGYSIASEGLNSSELSWYRDRVVALLNSHWRQPLLDGYNQSLTVKVDFTIHRDGHVTDINIARPSGVPSLDRSAVRAITDASPLLPLPKQVRSASLPSSFSFTWTPS